LETVFCLQIVYRFQIVDISVTSCELRVRTYRGITSLSFEDFTVLRSKFSLSLFVFVNASTMLILSEMCRSWKRFAAISSCKFAEITLSLQLLCFFAVLTCEIVLLLSSRITDGIAANRFQLRHISDKINIVDALTKMKSDKLNLLLNTVKSSKLKLVIPR
jgi:hypothetical protein